MDVHVVDLHNGAMLPFVDAVKSGMMPRRGNKMLHFDSHPDLGNIEQASPHLQSVAKGRFPKKAIYKMTDIATWITPLVLANQLDEVIWVCGHWCKQIKPGTYDLVCGLDGRGKLRTADADGTNTSHAITNYWDCDGAAGKLHLLKPQRRWTLHVVQYQKDGTLHPRDLNLITAVCTGNSWVLDIDEDFFSCNNPYKDSFEASFGARTFQLMKKIYEIGSGPDVAVKNILKKKLFLKPKSEFREHKLVKRVVDALNGEDLPGKKLMDGFYDAFSKAFQQPGDSLIPVEDLIDFEDMHETGTLSGLPHHISRVSEIATMGSATQELLTVLDRPAHVTLATSRTDRYLPDCQAVLIHGMLEEMMQSVYGDVNIIRSDKPKYSVVVHSDDE